MSSILYVGLLHSLVSASSEGRTRRLQEVANNPLYPNYRPGEATFMDQYCKYGCVVDALTAPLFYRLFFGYGYPMIGNELNFPAGYGGNGSFRTANPNDLSNAMALVDNALNA